MNEMQIRVLFFGVLKDVVGRTEECVELAEGSNIRGLYALYASRFPALEKHSASLLFSRNREFVSGTESLRDGDEVAFLPPVSGGATGEVKLSTESLPETYLCRLTREPIDTRSLVEELKQGEDGAVVVFEGVVRNHSGNRATLFLEYEAYEPMALEKMRAISQDIRRKFPVDRLGIVHRLGRLEIGEASVVIVVTSAHRRHAFDACREAIDRLKKSVPIWKKEHFTDGSIWVEGERASGSVPARQEPAG